MDELLTLNLNQQIYPKKKSASIKSNRLMKEGHALRRIRLPSVSSMMRGTLWLRRTLSMLETGSVNPTDLRGLAERRVCARTGPFSWMCTCVLAMIWMSPSEDSCLTKVFIRLLDGRIELCKEIRASLHQSNANQAINQIPSLQSINKSKRSIIQQVDVST